MKKVIATGSVLLEKDEEGKLVKEIAATVYAEEAKGKESGSGSGEGKKSVVLKYKNFEYAEDVAAPLGYDEIAGDAELVVPGVDGHADVALAAPVAIRYSRTKSFERNGSTAVYATIRYDM